VAVAGWRTAGRTEEEFVGPLASWRDLKRDYGAVADGWADDTAALQTALDDLIKHEKACVGVVTIRVDRWDGFDASLPLAVVPT
jgi:hypothetical protein